MRLSARWSNRLISRAFIPGLRTGSCEPGRMALSPDRGHLSQVRRGELIVSVAVLIAVGVNIAIRREVLGLEIGASEAEPIGKEFSRELALRGLGGVKLVVSDAHEGIKAAVSKVLSSTWQHCRARFMRNTLAHALMSGRASCPPPSPWRSPGRCRSCQRPMGGAAPIQIRPKIPKRAQLLASRGKSAPWER